MMKLRTPGVPILADMEYPIDLWMIKRSEELLGGCSVGKWKTLEFTLWITVMFWPPKLGSKLGPQE